jgi:tetratricopeptide (TPR) repeat protein
LRIGMTTVIAAAGCILRLCHDLRSSSGDMASSKKPGQRKKTQAEKSASLESAAAAELGSAEPLAERYYRLAETMNARGAMELAVPFYRQALVLLLEERNQLRQLLPEDHQRVFQVQTDDDLAGLLQAAHLLRAERNGSSDAQPSCPDDCQDLDSGVAELAEDLTPESARQVIAGLDELMLQYPGQVMPPDGHSLKGKALILLGQVVEGLDCFKAAYEADPSHVKHSINYAGSLLSQSRSHEALPILRSLHKSGLYTLSPQEKQAILRNLASAEDQQGRPDVALQLRHQWLLSQPDALSPERWLDFCRVGLVETVDRELKSMAVGMLEDLYRLYPKCRAAAEVLAEVLESLGDYRRTALIYRNLLRT